jgi:AcrR family transcriptional regulator
LCVKVKGNCALPTLVKTSPTPQLDGPSAVQPPTLRMPGHLRRDEILTAASLLYVTHGPAKTTTRQIAEAVGISQPSLYAHFPTKDALSYALAERSFAILEARMADVDAQAMTAKQHLVALITGYIAYALEEPSAYKIAFLLDLDIDKDVFLTLQEHVGLRAFGIFRDKIAGLQAQSFIKEGDIDTIAQSIWAAMHGLCALLLARPLFPWAKREDLIAAHVQLIVQGARPLSE